jgi:hypothetical protein
MTPNLTRLDLSFTGVRHLPKLGPDFSVPPLEKLSLTSTMMSMNDVLLIVEHLPCLRILSLGALGGSQGTSASISNSSAMTMNETMLRELTSVLDENCKGLENISLVGNTKLGMGVRKNSAIQDFIARVGRRCKVRALFQTHTGFAVQVLKMFLSRP